MPRLIPAQISIAGIKKPAKIEHQLLQACKLNTFYNDKDQIDIRSQCFLQNYIHRLNEPVSICCYKVYRMLQINTGSDKPVVAAGLHFISYLVALIVLVIPLLFVMVTFTALSGNTLQRLDDCDKKLSP